MREAFVVEVRVELAEGTDPAALGAAVTIELCGHWEHEGACRWPHNSVIDPSQNPAVFRTLYIADSAQADDVRRRIEKSLEGWPEWSIVSCQAREVRPEEQGLAKRLASSG